MKKYFVIGNPIDHSLSPQLHNYWLKKNNINGVYDKKKLDSNDLKDLVLKIKNNEINGLNITVPFKNEIIPYLDELSNESKSTQSVNTIYFYKDKIVGHNTDIDGFDASIKKLNFNMKGKKILILGAGGVVPSIVFALKNMHVSEIVVSNRTIDKAENLKNLFDNLKVIEWGNLPNFDVVINATSLGLKNETINLDFSSVGKNKLFYDVIYNPAQTNFLTKGKELGNLIENGKNMFIYQASEAFKLWHNINPKVNEDTFRLLEND